MADPVRQAPNVDSTIVDTTLQDPLIGRSLDSRYRVESRIARGGMATVYLAMDLRLDREVALKVMHGHLVDDEQFVARFVREARSAARLSHPNVVQVFDQGADAGYLYLAMEYLPGRTLREVLDERGALTPREAFSILDPTLDALAAAHRAGIVHRDIKPENVILTDDGRVKVADFGLARAVTASTSTTSALVGTVAYLSPELVARGIADARSDVYAAGILLFEMLTGRQPFTGDVAIQVAFRHVHDAVPRPSELVPDLPVELDDLVAAATARDPDERPPDAAAFLARLRAARAGVVEEALDVRPARAREAAAPASGPEAVTEVVAADLGRRQTRALPVARGGDRLPVLRPGPVVPARGPVAEGPALMARRRRRGRLALIALLVAALAIGGSAWWFARGPGAFTGTPRVVGETAAQAGASLRLHGLKANVELVFDDAVPPQQVVRTEPAGGRQVAKGGTVTLFVSRGPQLVDVPAVTGLSQDDATAALTTAGLKVGQVTGAYDPDITKGLVVSSSPAPGQKQHKDRPVALVMSKGPRPVAVPDVRGRTRDDATAALTGVGLVPVVPAVGGERYDDKVPAGSVVAQSPVGGTLLPGQAVTLTMSKGPPLVLVPNVFQMTMTQARRVLEAAGFTVRRQGTRVFDQVFSQSPGAGTMAPRGSTVTVRTF